MELSCKSDFIQRVQLGLKRRIKSKIADISYKILERIGIYKMDFLSFKTFISTEALIGFYYLGAIILPVFSWLFINWLIGKYELLNSSYKNGKKLLWKSLSKKQQTTFVIFFIIAFLFMELFWRMLFEFLIAYMQIRDALFQI